MKISARPRSYPSLCHPSRCRVVKPVRAIAFCRPTVKAVLWEDFEMSSRGPVITNQAGRQPIIDYVTKDYDGFRQAMLNQIPLLLPNWKTRGESDFGVVLIELFAYVADI